jgi:uncharacterized protein YbjT (DUF2867 family)
VFLLSIAIFYTANVFANPSKYDGQNLRLVGERITMDNIAAAFEDLFGKPVIYNPLTVREVAAMPFAAAPAMAQMCQFVGDPRSLAHDVEGTLEVLNGKKSQTFEDWLLTHSESSAFQECGLTLDAPNIEKVTVFGASSREGTSVVKGLLADTRRNYSIRAVVTDQASKLQLLAPDRVELVQVDLDSMESCMAAVNGVDGVFLVTHYLHEDHAEELPDEERHIRNVIDACEAAQSVRHLVFSSPESADVMNHHMKEQDSHVVDGNTNLFDARARAAAYARTKKLSVTYVLLPYYTENFLENLKRYMDKDGKEKMVVDDVPKEKQDTKVVCMSIDDLGPAVANIFDSYQVYAGHEIGLVTDFKSYSDFQKMMEDAILQGSSSEETPFVAEDEIRNRSKHSYPKDLGQMFGTLAHSDAVKMRRSVAKTMDLVPSARPLREWIEQNRNNEAFREKLGLR